MNRNEKLNKIKNYLIRIEENIRYDTAANLFDINKHCENIYCRLLNIIYNYNLRNANIDKKNYDAVDLIDDNNHIYIQVTSTNTREKIQHTINEFIKNSYYEENHLIILLINGKKKKYRQTFNTQGKFLFNIKNDILDNCDLYAIINHLSIEQISSILNYLEEEIDEKFKFVDLSQFTKIDKIETEYFSTRQVYKTSEYKKDGYFSMYKHLNINQALEENNRVVIISEAGLGKSELCKNIVNNINNKENQFAFYYKLLNYAGDSIEKLKPALYKKIPNEYVTFVLDGYDEITNEFKNIFIKQIQNFIEGNKNVKIIITSRSNFYRSNGVNQTIDNFESYYLLPLNKENVKDLVKYYKVDYESFICNVKKSNLYQMLYNPFYATFFIQYYKKYNILLKKEELMPEIIKESLNNDIKKFKSTKNFEDEKNRLFKILKLLSFSMALLEKNYLTMEEFSKLIKEESDRKLLDYSSLWKKENDKVMFSHNNFFEYLASETLQDLDYSVIKKLVTYNEFTFNPNWMNIVIFMISKKYNDDFIDWLLSIYSLFIFHLRKEQINQERRTELFIKTFNLYEKKKIWLPNDIYNNNIFAEFIYSQETVKFLLSKLKSDNHYTVILNSLNLLVQLQDYGDLYDEVKEKLINLLYSKEFNTSQKRIALNILSDKRMIDDTELNNIIISNKNEEDPYLRTAYFYYLNKNGINEKNINLIFDEINTIKPLRFGRKNNDIYLADEHVEFENLFSQFKDANLLDLLLDKISTLYKKDSKEFLTETITKNICESIFNLEDEQDKKAKLIFKLYVIAGKNYIYESLKTIAYYLDKNNLTLEIFKIIINSNELLSFHSISYLINEQCLSYFYNEYKKEIYNDDLAKIILCSSNEQKGIPYIQINNLYCKKTGVNIIEERKNNTKVQIQKDNIIQEYFESLFDKELFFSNLQQYLEHLKLKNSKIIDKEEMKKLRDDFYYDRNIYIIDFLRKFKREDGTILISDIQNINWDYFVLSELYTILISDDKIDISSKQKSIINKICQTHLHDISFRNAIQYKENGNISTSYLSIYLWFFRYKLNLKYPEDVLLDMLSFDWSPINNVQIGIKYIENEVSEYKVKNRIIENLKTQTFYGDVLKNHVNYCISHDIDNMTEFVIPYLFNKKMRYYDKREIIEYILKYNSIEYIKNKLLDKMDFETQLCFIDEIYKIDKKELVEYIKEKCQNTEEFDKKIIYINYLIRSNNLWGLKQYYMLLKKRMCCVDLENCYQNTIQNALSQVNFIDCLQSITDIYLLTCEKNFKDDHFNSVYSGCKNAFINIALSDIKNDSHVKTIQKLQDIIIKNQKLQDIGFTYYIIEEIQEKILAQGQKKYNVFEVIDIINNLFPKQGSTGLIY